MPTMSVLWSDGTKDVTQSGVAATKTSRNLDTIEQTITLPPNTKANRVYWTMYLSDLTGSDPKEVRGAYSVVGSSTIFDMAQKGISYSQDMVAISGQTNTYRLRLGVRVRNPDSTTPTWGTAKWRNIYLNVDYESITTACTAPTSVTISTNSAAPGGTATLSWSGASAGTANAITGYRVYRSTSAGGTYEPLCEVKDTSSTSGNVSVSAGSNETIYYYKVCTLGSVADFDSPISANYAYLTATYNNPTVSSFKINSRTNTIWIGKEASQSLTASWEAADGVNNPIKEYQIYKIWKKEGGTEEESQPIWVGEGGTFRNAQIEVESGYQYCVRAFGGYGDNSFGESERITCASLEPGNFSFSPISYSGSRTFKLSWGTPSPYPPQGSIASSYYDVYYLYPRGTGNHVGRTTDTNYTVTIPTSVPAGRTFRFMVNAVFFASDGGYSIASVQSNDLKIPGAPNAPVITSIYDTRCTLESKTTGWGYRYIKIKVKPAEENTANASGNIFTYRLYYSVNNGAYQYESFSDREISGEDPSLDRNLESYGVSPGSTVTFYIQATDNYGYSVNSNSVSMRRFQLPSITWGNISSTADTNSRVTNTISGGFNGIIVSNQGSQTINYEVAVSYNGNKGASTTGSYTTTNLNTFSFSVLCPQSNASDSFSRALYTTVITNQNPAPQGQINVKLYYEGYAAYSVTVSKNFNFNYIKPLSANPTYTIDYPSGRNYFNPFESYDIICGAVNWINAAGEGNGTGGTLTRTCTRSGSPRTIVGNNVQDSFQNYTSSDTVVNYIITHTLTYAGYPSYSSSKSTTVSVNIARWYKDSTVLQNTTLDRADSSHCKLKGRLLLPQLLCASGKYSNITSVQYRFKDTQSGSYFPPSGWLTPSQAELNARTIELDVDFGKYNDVIIYAEAQYTNTAGGIINSVSNTSILHDNSTTVALRKGYLGINVPQGYGYIKTPDSTIEINQGEIKKPTLLGLKADSDTTNYICFNNGTQDIGRIVNKADTNSMFFEGLSYQISISIGTSNYTTEGTDGWETNNYKIFCPYVTEKTSQEIYPQTTITATQLKALQKAQFIGNEQANGQFSIKAMGIKPTINIPIILVVRGF